MRCFFSALAISATVTLVGCTTGGTAQRRPVYFSGKASVASLATKTDHYFPINGDFLVIERNHECLESVASIYCYAELNEMDQLRSIKPFSTQPAFIVDYEGASVHDQELLDQLCPLISSGVQTGEWTSSGDLLKSANTSGEGCSAFFAVVVVLKTPEVGNSDRFRPILGQVNVFIVENLSGGSRNIPFVGLFSESNESDVMMFKSDIASRLVSAYKRLWENRIK